MNRSKSQSPASLLSVFVFVAVALFTYYKNSKTPTHPATTSHSRTSSRVKARQVQLDKNKADADNAGTTDTAGATQAGDSNEGNLLLGNPTKAATDPDNFLLERSQYTMSFNHSRGEPNWVSWHVDYADSGDIKRGKFRPDPELPADWRITPGDYTGSGYDRGHMCPSADRNSTREDNDATFYMSNMVPQTAALNQHIWADLENYVRDTVRAGNEVYQICGPAGTKETIAGGKVTAPASCWKVIVVIPEATGDLARIDAKTRVIAVSMPNDQTDELMHGDWRTMITTPKKIEDATGLNFFATLPPKVKTALENKVDAGD